MNIDDEWKMYLANQSTALPEVTIKPKLSIDDDKKLHMDDSKINENVPKCDDLYISTKTKVLFLNFPVDIHTIFWKIPVIEYWIPKEGVIKKQMKIVSNSPEEYEEMKKKLVGGYYFTENIIKKIDNPTARRNKFKDERKITIGISKKDIINSRGKVKNAFYNCFAVILRFYYENSYREIHVKVFNTGKLEIPGIINYALLDIVKRMIIDLLQEHTEHRLAFVDTNCDENVLINSNFNCGFFINREKLHSILRGSKYNIESAFDPCSYPGVKCKFYFNNELGFDIAIQKGNITATDCSLKMNELSDNKKYTEVSFMIFRTGSCLIVGNCSEKILLFVFEFLKRILSNEYEHIVVKNEIQVVKNKKVKLRKKTIIVSQS
jgi:hypothetical protein